MRQANEVILVGSVVPNTKARWQTRSGQMMTFVLRTVEERPGMGCTFPHYEYHLIRVRDSGRKRLLTHCAGFIAADGRLLYIRGHLRGSGWISAAGMLEQHTVEVEAVEIELLHKEEAGAPAETAAGERCDEHPAARGAGSEYAGRAASCVVSQIEHAKAQLRAALKGGRTERLTG